MFKQTKRNLKRRYRQSRAMRLTIWLYIIGLSTFALNLTSLPYADLWQFGRDYYDVMIAYTLLLSMPIWLCLYIIAKQNERQFRKDKLCYQLRLENYRLLEQCLTPDTPEKALQQMAQAIRNTELYGEEDEKQQAHMIGNYIAQEAGYQFEDVITLLKITRTYLRDMLEAEQPKATNDTLYLLQLPELKKSLKKKKAA